MVIYLLHGVLWVSPSIVTLGIDFVKEKIKDLVVKGVRAASGSI